MRLKGEITQARYMGAVTQAKYKSAINYMPPVLMTPDIIYDGNTVAWYDFNDLSTITKDGGNLVSRWNDKLLSGHDLIQATATKQPLLSSDGILFDGVDDFMKTVAFTFDQPEMIYIVFKQVTWTSLDKVFDGDSYISGTLYQSVNTPELRLWAGGAIGGNNNLPVDTFGIVRALINAASSKTIVNNTTPQTGTVGASNMGGFTLGAGANSTQCGHIQVKEIIPRKIADNETDETAIYNYLKNKYGL